MVLQRILARSDVPRDVKRLIEKFLAEDLDNSETGLHSELTRLLFKKIPLGFAYHEIVVDEQNEPVDYIFLDVNEEFEKLTGLKREEIIGKLLLARYRESRKTQLTG